MDMLPVELVGGQRLAMGPDELVVLADGEQTNGEIFAVLLRMPPGGGPPVMHRHGPSEVYHVLEGEFAFYLTGADGHTDRVPVRAGQVMPIAGGVPHSIRNESDRDAVAFGVHSPGEAMEGFARAAARLADSGTPTMDELLDVAARNGIELLGPIPVS